MGRVLRGAIAVRGRVFRAGQEAALERAAAAAGVDLNDPRFAGVFGDDPGTPERAPVRKKGTTVETKPSISANLKTAEDVQAAFTVRDAPRYLARIEDRAEVERLAALDTRSSTAKLYAERLEALK